MNEPIFSLEEIAEAFKYIQDNKLSTDAKAMLTMDIGYERAEKDIIKLLEKQFASSYWSDLSPEFLIALIKGEK